MDAISVEDLEVDEQSASGEIAFLDRDDKVPLTIERNGCDIDELLDAANTALPVIEGDLDGIFARIVSEMVEDGELPEGDAGTTLDDVRIDSVNLTGMTGGAVVIDLSDLVGDGMISVSFDEQGHFEEWSPE